MIKLKLGSKGVTYLTLPHNLQTPENYALSAAFDYEMSLLLEFLEKLQLWTALDKVDARYYDQLAGNLRALYYQSDYSDVQKFGIIKTALQVYMYAGTKKAIQELLNSIFENASFVPWYEYDGLPYHFKIQVAGISSENMVSVFNTILAKVKAKREILDSIEIVENDETIVKYIYAGHRVEIIRQTLT